MKITKNYLFFWKEWPSQWKRESFREVIDDVSIQFKSCEHYMMYRKATLFPGNEEITKQILETEHPSDVKRFGRMVKNFDSFVWDSLKWDVVYRGNYLRFTQNPASMKKLLETGNVTLVEASPYDRIWGIGMGEDDCNLMNVHEWGENLLGKILTQLREDLKNNTLLFCE